MKSCRIHLLAVFIICRFISANCKQSYILTQVDVINYPGQAIGPNLRLVGRDRSINGTFAVLQNLNDDTLVKVEFLTDSTGTGDYKPMAYTLPAMGICHTFKSYYKKYLQFLDQKTDFNFEEGEVCPIPKGNYNIKDINIDATEWPSVVPRGNLKGKITLTKRQKFVGGFDIIVNISNDL